MGTVSSQQPFVGGETSRLTIDPETPSPADTSMVLAID
jgi:hypothetical protein